MTGRALIGVRCSTDEQLDKFGPEVQLKACLEAAASAGLDVDQVADVVVDSQSVTRYAGAAEIDLQAPFYREVFSRLTTGHYTAYITYDATRLTRSGLLQQLLLEAEIKRHVERVIYATLPIDDSTIEGRMIRDIMASVNQARSALDKQRLRDARHARAERGKYAGGVISYGYRVDDEGNYLVDEAAAEVVRQMFRWYALVDQDLNDANVRGQGLVWIAAELNRRGVVPPSAKRWDSSAVSNILRNKTYLGQAHYASTRIPVPPIVDADLWARAVERRSRWRWYSRRPKMDFARFLVHRRMRCGYCHRYTRIIVSGSGEKHAYYRCDGYGAKLRTGEPCPERPSIRADWLDGQVCDSLQAVAAGRGLEYALTGYLEVWQREWAEAERQLPAVEEAIAEIDDEIDRAGVNFARGRWDEARADAYVAEARQRLDYQREELRRLHASLARRQRFQELLGRMGLDSLDDVALVRIPDVVADHVPSGTVRAAVDDALRPEQLQPAAARALLAEYDVTLTLWQDRVEVEGLVPLPSIARPESVVTQEILRDSPNGETAGIPFALAIKRAA